MHWKYSHVCDFCIFLKPLSFFGLYILKELYHYVVSRDEKKMQSLKSQVHFDWALTLQISFYVLYQLNSDKTAHPVSLCGGDFKYFLTLLRHVRCFLCITLDFISSKLNFNELEQFFRAG